MREIRGSEIQRRVDRIPPYIIMSMSIIDNVMSNQDDKYVYIIFFLEWQELR